MSVLPLMSENRPFNLLVDLVPLGMVSRFLFVVAVSSTLDVPDVVTGRTPLMMADWSPIAAQVKSGSLRALAAPSSKRWALLPDVPTLAEQGFPATTWRSGSASSRRPRPPLPSSRPSTTRCARWNQSDQARSAASRD